MRPCERASSGRAQAGAHLFPKYLQHGLVLGGVELGECLLHERAIFKAAFVQQFVEPERRVAQQNLGILQLPIIACEGHVDAMGKFLRALQQAGGTLNVSSGDLLGAELDHLVNKLRVKEALFLWLGLAGAQFQSIEGLLIGDLVV